MPQPDKRTLLAEGLAAAMTITRCTRASSPRECRRAAAKYEVDRLAKDPMAAMLRRQAARMAKQGWLLANQERLAREAEGGFALDTLDNPEADAFYHLHYEANRPAKLTGLIDHWPALARWCARVISRRLRAMPSSRRRSNASADPDYELAKDDHRPARAFRRTDRMASGGYAEQ
jgi:hypothetical protein